MPDPAWRIEPWCADDLPLLERLVGDPAMMEHLGGPESPERIAERHARYQRIQGREGRMFTIVEVATGTKVGSVGYWARTWRDERVYETGWSVIPAFQGRGAARTATAQVIDAARAEGARWSLHAYPSVDNAPSNGICRTLGFTLLGECSFEYPPGHPLVCNDWRLDLRPGG